MEWAILSIQRQPLQRQMRQRQNVVMDTITGQIFTVTPPAVWRWASDGDFAEPKDPAQQRTLGG